MRLLISLSLIAALLVPTAACSRTELIEAVATQYTSQQPGLESYRVDLQTNKLDEMLTRMTGNMPQDVPRPAVPDLIKFWARNSGSVIRSKTVTTFPYMQQMINRFSQRFAIELGTFFLPLEAADKRADMLRQATVKSSESQIAETSTYHFDIIFDKPTDLDGAFYGHVLDLPQRQVEKLSLDIDPQKLLLIHLDIIAREQPPLAVEIRHLEVEGNSLPKDVFITSPDGSVDEKITTEFEKIRGYYLPTRQDRSIHRPGLDETMSVTFSNYVINPER